MPPEHSEVEKQQTDGSYPETLGGKSRWLQLMIQMWLFKKGFGPIVNALSSLPNSRKREDYSSQTRLCLLITQISNALWPNLAKLSIFYKLAIPGYWVNFQRIMWGRVFPTAISKFKLKFHNFFHMKWYRLIILKKSLLFNISSTNITAVLSCGISIQILW